MGPGRAEPSPRRKRPKSRIIGQPSRCTPAAEGPAHRVPCVERTCVQPSSSFPPNSFFQPLPQLKLNTCHPGQGALWPSSGGQCPGRDHFPLVRCFALEKVLETHCFLRRGQRGPSKTALLVWTSVKDTGIARRPDHLCHLWPQCALQLPSWAIAPAGH